MLDRDILQKFSVKSYTMDRMINVMDGISKSDGKNRVFETLIINFNSF